MKIQCAADLESIDVDQWRPLQSSNFPFTDYWFIKSLEDSDCLGERTGWYPRYLCAWDKGILLGVLIVYLKTNSYGEYIFDWDWAHAYQQHKIPYYPKLTSASPFTPANGSKWLIHPMADANQVKAQIVEHLKNLAVRSQASSIHHLFIPKQEIAEWKQAGYTLRWSHQYHWRNKSYETFDQFLSNLKGKRAKEVRRERRQAHESGWSLKTLTGDQIEVSYAESFYGLYLSTIDKKNSFDYLTQDFFKLIFERMKDSIVLTCAFEGDTIMAASLAFLKGNKLYGRYWGSLKAARSLHFELCYYSLIEFAIKNKIDIFEAGAQGEHKIQRGFEPQWTYSCHWLAHPAFNHAIQKYIDTEKSQLHNWFAVQSERSPYKED